MVIFKFDFQKSKKCEKMDTRISCWPTVNFFLARSGQGLPKRSWQTNLRYCVPRGALDASLKSTWVPSISGHWKKSNRAHDETPTDCKCIHTHQRQAGNWNLEKNENAQSWCKHAQISLTNSRVHVRYCVFLQRHLENGRTSLRAQWNVPLKKWSSHIFG